MHACLIRENREHLYPRNIPAIRYVFEQNLDVKANNEVHFLQNINVFRT